VRGIQGNPSRWVPLTATPATMLRCPASSLARSRSSRASFLPCLTLVPIARPYGHAEFARHYSSGGCTGLLQRRHDRMCAVAHASDAWIGQPRINGHSNAGKSRRNRTNRACIGRSSAPRASCMCGADTVTTRVYAKGLRADGPERVEWRQRRSTFFTYSACRRPGQLVRVRGCSTPFRPDDLPSDSSVSICTAVLPAIAPRPDMRIAESSIAASKRWREGIR